MVEAGRHLNIELLTYSEIQDISRPAREFPGGDPEKGPFGGYEIDPAGCGVCLENCPIRYEVQVPEGAEALARSAYAKATDEAKVTEMD